MHTVRRAMLASTMIIYDGVKFLVTTAASSSAPHFLVSTAREAQRTLASIDIPDRCHVPLTRGPAQEQAGST